MWHHDVIQIGVQVNCERLASLTVRGPESVAGAAQPLNLGVELSRGRAVVIYLYHVWVLRAIV